MHTSDKIQQELLDMIDRRTAPPLDWRVALDVLENLVGEIELRIDGIRDDYGYGEEDD